MATKWFTAINSTQIPYELKIRCYGCRAEAKRTQRRRKFKPPLLSIIIDSVRSLATKMDAL